jgi:Fic family protein
MSDLEKFAHNDIGEWFKFFLSGIVETAQSGISTFDKILKLSKEIEEKLQTRGGRAVSAYRLMDYLYTQPLLNAERVSKGIQQSLTSAYKLIQDLGKLGILVEVTGNRRGKTYIFIEYFDLFR